ncbi:MAG: tRNA (guanosine(37)-N1)-methyltransferase TrmD [Chloroflexi bacterium CG07_land_8_20_14_0_80_51_10]|nr:MAG: tRNA (guanosine(37)-N1)-methyltransferase TrmD [Chloroflexi bacterium CG07_land_8_20_14_0_80_51_10]
MRIDILTLFPKMFEGPFKESIIKRAVERGLVSLFIHNIRDYAHDRHHTVDDYPYGGGAGMVLKPEPLFEAVESIKAELPGSTSIILLSPQGRLFCHRVAQELSTYDNLILICGHYEGVDERVREHLISDELSIGDYVLTGGELAAMVVVDAVVRLLPSVLGSELSAKEDSFAQGLLKYPQYTRPPVYRGWEVPPILLSGNHEEIERWRREQAMQRTLKQRPDLLEKAELSERES